MLRLEDIPKISIHALLAESDVDDRASYIEVDDFNPRSPRGERPFQAISTSICRDFNPRSPRGERPVGRVISAYLEKISIHALLAESDQS